MSLTHRWTGFTDAELIGQLRLDCYGSGLVDRPKFMASVTDDPRAQDGDFLLVEQGARPVGTAMSLRLTGYVRGAKLPVQGVAYVGASRTERRKATTGGASVATTVMKLTIEKARERGDVLSALMPFRASYYEHFGYGIVERRSEWTLPVGLLPVVATDGIKLCEAHDVPALVEAKGAIARAGQCDFERPEGEWRRLLTRAEAGFTVVDREGAHARGWATFMTEPDASGVRAARVTDWGARTNADFVRLLAFFGTLKDQYARVHIVCPADWQVSRLLKESQVPHRPVPHPTASWQTHTRMQVRVMDHHKLLEAIRWPEEVKGTAEVCVHECEGRESRFIVQVKGGAASVRAGGTGKDFTTKDSHWAAVAMGDVSAAEAVRLGLAASESGSFAVLGGLMEGPKAYSLEYF